MGTMTQEEKRQLLKLLIAYAKEATLAQERAWLVQAIGVLAKED